MFERFTDQARNLIVRAQAQARDLRHPYIGTEHLLLALLDPDAGAASVVLREAGLEASRARQDVERLVGGGRVLTAEDAAALEAIGIDLPAVLARIENTLGPGALTMPGPKPSGRRRLLRRRQRATGQCVPFTARAKKVLELSWREAIALRHDRIEPEHILLGLIREGQGLAAQVLTEAGVDLGRLRRATLAALDAAA